MPAIPSLPGSPPSAVPAVPPPTQGRRPGGWRWAALILAVAALVAPGRGWARVYDPETFRLSNGMQVVVVTNHRAPVVSHMVWYKVGAADEPRGKSGLAHYLEHLMFKGTPTVPAGDFSRIVARNGGQENAFTNYDQTAYYQNIARDRLPLVMKLEADRMDHLAIKPDVAKPELAVVLEERRQRTDNNPAARLSESVAATLFQNYPYRIPVVGWMDEVAALTPQDAQAFYRTWYAPNNAILIVSGDITAAELKPLAEATYGRIKARPVPARLTLRPAEPGTQAARRVTLKDGQVRQPSWSRTWLAPSYGWGDRNLRSALQVLDTVMGGGTTARLYQALVVRQKLAVSAGFFYEGSSLGPGTIGLDASPAPGVGLDAVETAMQAELDRLLKDGVTEEEVAAAKKRLLPNAQYARDSLQGPAMTLGQVLTSGGTIDDVESWPDRIAAVTAADVTAAARAVLSAPASVTALLLPDPEAAAQARSGPPPAPPPSPLTAGGVR